MRELCDDSFEEHVLAYTPDIAGLYLHGLNLNLPDFAPRTRMTWWISSCRGVGFRKNDIHHGTCDVDKVKAFLDEVAETGHYMKDETPKDSLSAARPETLGRCSVARLVLQVQVRGAVPDVPAVARMHESGHRRKNPQVTRSTKRSPRSTLLYARRRLIADPSLGKRYNDNHGIIALRNDFLNSKGLKGSDIIRLEMENGEHAEVTNNIILVPIATIGCGKTTLGVALCKLFGWQEFQNDNIEGKVRRPERFVDAVTMRLAASPVVFADRNNHQKREREQFIGQATKLVQNVTLVALHWVHDAQNMPRIQESLRERVLSRGDNHQTIHAGSKSQSEILEIMDGFIRRFEPLDSGWCRRTATSISSSASTHCLRLGTTWKPSCPNSMRSTRPFSRRRCRLPTSSTTQLPTP